MEFDNSPRTPKLTSVTDELKEVLSKRKLLTTQTRMKVLSTLDEFNDEQDASKEENLRSQAIQEILTSEISYINQLEIIRNFFMGPILDKKLLSRASYSTLFENIDTIYNVNNELVQQLKQNPENIARAFHTLAPFFKLYSVYAYNYKQALDLLQQILENSPEVSKFIANQESRPEVSQKLSSLLIAPIQRVPRYKLLLQQVIRHTSPRTKAYNELQASLVEIEKVASHINSMVEEYENTQQLLELQKVITNLITLVKPGRKLVRHGKLMRVGRGARSAFRRYFILCSDMILYCKGDPESTMECSCVFPLNKTTIKRVFSTEVFSLTCKEEYLLLYSEMGDSEQWITAIEEAIEKYQENRQSLRKDSSSRIPVRKFIPINKDGEIDNRLRRKRPLTSIKENNDNSLKSNNSNVDMDQSAGEKTTSKSNSPFSLPFKRLKKSPREDVAAKKHNGILRNDNSNDKIHETIFSSKIFSRSCLSMDVTDENNTDNQENFRLLSFKTVGTIISKVSNGLKSLFYKN
ncbi:hypothetical protein TKK_0001175 [Trichogramma kaykai]|uniref:DH domain-containing protein n=1 Tax=Trichogramma kaykai TaxID=54128 RepID=A0ABD2WWB6_9HYME